MTPDRDRERRSIATGYGQTVQRRVARKPRPCPSCDRLIVPGATYLEHKSFPGCDDGWGDAAGHPVRMAECSGCATPHGREAWLAGAR